MRETQTVRVELVQLSRAGLVALALGDRLAVETETGFELTDYMVSAWRSTWQRRAAQVHADPLAASWITRLVLDPCRGLVVGRAGFHGPPDEDGRVEIGYAVDPLFRRQGYARAAVTELILWAGREEAVTTVRAAVRPDNTPSWRVLAPWPFTSVGEQWDDEDGLETIVELATEDPRRTATGRLPA